MKTWHATHKIEEAASHQIYWVSHLERGRTTSKQWKMTHPEEVREYRRDWYRNHPEKAREMKAKRRLLGFNQLNSWFLGCEGHHINPQDVIYMPRKLHRSVYHNQYTGKGMTAMNALAGQFLTEDWT
jgi:hypothetical protein